MQDKLLSAKDELIEKIDIQPVELIRTFYPFTLIRRIYLTISIFARNSLINHAASGAFYFLLSVVPLALFFVFVLDIWLSGYGKVSDYFFQLLSNINPAINRQFFESMGLLKGSSSFYGLVGALGLLWSSRLVFTSIRNGFDIIFISSKKRGILKNNLVSLIFLPITFVAALSFFITSAVTKQLNKLINEFGLNDLIDLSFLNSLTSYYPVILALFIAFILYKFIPKVKIKGTYALAGAILFIVSIYFTQKLLGVFINASKYNLIYGVISALIIALIWTYVLFILFYFFATFIYVISHYAELEIVKYYNTYHYKPFLLDRLMFTTALSSMKQYELKLNKDDKLFSCNQQGGYIYLLLSGIVFLERDGKFIADIPTNSFFGESGVVGDMVYSTDAVCQVPGYALKIPKEMYEKIVSVSPDISKELLNNIIERGS